MKDRCGKCGGDQVTYRYHGSRLNCLWAEMNEQGTEGEHIHLCCSRCSYTWTKPALTAKELDDLQRADQQQTTQGG